MTSELSWNISHIPNVGDRHDPITRTWLKGLALTAAENHIRPLCWHFEHDINGTVVSGYVTVTLLHEASTIRRSWADVLQLDAVVDKHGVRAGYEGSVGNLTIRLPDAIDPDEHCQLCGEPIDPRVSMRASEGICHSCGDAGDDRATSREIRVDTPPWSAVDQEGEQARKTYP